MTNFTKGTVILGILLITLILPSYLLSTDLLLQIKTELLIIRELLFGAASFYLIKSQQTDDKSKQ